MLERMWNKGNTPSLLVGLQTWTATMKINMVVPQKIGNWSTSQPSYIPLLGTYPNDTPSYHKDSCSTMSIVSLLIIARTWKQPRCPSTKEWTKKREYIHTMENYSAVKNNNNKKDIINFTGKSSKVGKKIILSEVTQTQKDKHGMSWLKGEY